MRRKYSPKSPAVERECRLCSKPFTIPGAVARYGFGFYCSRACMHEWARRYSPKNIAVKCAHCGVEFRTYVSHPRVYCSNTCKGKALWAVNSGHSPDARRTVNCEVCGVPFSTTAKRPRFCGHKCQGVWSSATFSRENSVFWRGGKRRNYGPTWREAQRLTRERDSVCVDCGATPEALGCALDVHHVRPFRLFGLKRHAEANALDNLVGLCDACHGRRDRAIQLSER